jgi:Outer membrane protein beta-barrel domain
MTRFLAALAITIAVAEPAQGQVAGLPVFNNGVPRGLTVAFDAGFPDDESGGGETYALTGGLGFGLLGFTATLGSTDTDFSDNEAIYGGTANLRIIGGPLVPVSVNLQGGVGFADIAGTKYTHVPVGVGVGLTIPLPVLGLKPWIAPRWDYLDRDPGAGSAESESAFGYSAGLDMNFVFGLGARVAYDSVDRDGGDASTWSVGAKWTFGL